ncbi:unnamed protein product [Heligmosomoides polygyrus]|uniref:Uncharacterized protein n=1 Tax=Heligmosomoides polygyrus TaxID=6339 RepID=A0A183FTV0_HELPZ|nr:unnamed protein product [Heligmosomoides polygyrus]
MAARTVCGNLGQMECEGITESNIAETFHRYLLTEVKKKRPPLETLVKVLKSMTAQSKAKLLHHQRYAPEPLRERDKRRQLNVNTAMRKFGLRRARGYLSTRAINTYCIEQWGSGTESSLRRTSISSFPLENKDDVYCDL